MLLHSQDKSVSGFPKEQTVSVLVPATRRRPNNHQDIESLSNKRIIRVFPRRNNATPIDQLAYVGLPDFWAQADEVHISVTFTWDLPIAERLEKEWKHIAPVKIGGPATGMMGEDFKPGMYLKPGYVITSRGCPNRCWFCSVWKRDGNIRHLPIAEGFDILDDNLLACSDTHIKSVFAMLSRQTRKPKFTGGLEAARMKPWIADELRKLKPESAYFAYDTPDDLEPLRAARKMLYDAGFTGSGHWLRCYVLCGYPNDTIAAAEKRMRETMAAGYLPMAMLWRDRDGNRKSEWITFARIYARPSITGAIKSTLN